MLETVIAFTRYLTALLFGVAVSVSLAGMKGTRKNYLAFSCFIMVFFILQASRILLFGMDFTIKIYPLLSHIPVFFYITAYLKRSWLISITCVLVSYLCCQPPRWIGAVAGQIFNSASADHAGYILAALLMFSILKKYVVDSARYMMERSIKSCLLFAAMPAFYYVFDYVTTFYTGFLFTNVRSAALFMPFITAAFYFVFLLLYYAETQNR